MKYLLALLTAACLTSQAKGDDLAQLKVLYWDCDWEATQGLVSFDRAAECSLAFERLKASFHPDNGSEAFKLYMDWWRANKVVEHEKRRSRVEQRL